MRRAIVMLMFACAAFVAAMAARGSSPSSSISTSRFAQQQGAAPSPIPSPQNPAAPPPVVALPAQTPVTEPVRSGPMIVLDPAHGGTDTGARGANGLTEKEQVLILARMVRSDLERNGFHVILTRNDDSNPSYEDRSAVANAYRDAIFISLHVSSTGKFGTARAYSYEFPSQADSSAGDGEAAGAARVVGALVPWEEAQKSHVDASKRLADLLQLQLLQRFSGSPQNSQQYAVRDLRSVAAPAVAIEISSVAVTDPNGILALGGPLASAVVHAVAALRPLGVPVGGGPVGGGQP